jgi:hypothetical protein
MDFKFLKSIVSSLLDLGEPAATELLTSELAELSLQRATLSTAEECRAHRMFQQELLDTVHQSAFCRYAYAKPRGYPGDFVTQEMIWLSRTKGQKHRYAGDTEVGRVINSITMNMDNCAANEHRVYFLRRVIQESRGGRVASIGCGSCIELWDGSALQGREDWDFVLVDQDADALEGARRAIALPSSKARTVRDNVLRFILRAERCLGQRDLVYLFGLLDYFSEASARKIVERLWPVIAVDGELVVTNAHPSNPSRLWMEYVTDWYLEYKTADSLLGLAENLAHCTAEVVTDDVGVYQYLRLRRAA